MRSQGLRERKKAQTRSQVAAAAARLFAERGYEHVSIADVAAAAEVSEQTVYNYFGTKERLVTDLDSQLTDELAQLIAQRPQDTSPATAIRSRLLDFIASFATLDTERSRGELGYLARVSPTVRRLMLEMIDRQAQAFAQAIGGDANNARLQGIALAGVLQIIIETTGAIVAADRTPVELAAELTATATVLLDTLDSWHQ